MSAESGTWRRQVSSIPANPGTIAAVQRLLAFVDELPPGASGALRFGEHGAILLQNRRICWAMARSTRLRLTDILCGQSPSLTRGIVETAYRSCRESGTPIGEALVASGLVNEQELRSALFRHNGEAIAALARAGATPDEFTHHNKPDYDPRFAFASCEILAMLGSRDDPARAVAAQRELHEVLVPESFGAAYARSRHASGALLIAVDRECDFAAGDIVNVCNWAAGLFDVAQTFDPEVFAARAAWGPSASLVTWRQGEVGYVGLCASRAAAARLVSRVSERATRASQNMPALAGGAERA